MIKTISKIGRTFCANNLVASLAERFPLRDSWVLDCSTKTILEIPGRCSITTRRIIIKKWRNNPKMIQMSMNLIVDVCGSFEATELLRVYITSMAVMATGMLVLKCSLLKYKVSGNIIAEIKYFFIANLSNGHNEQREIILKQGLRLDRRNPRALPKGLQPKCNNPLINYMRYYCIT